MRKRPPPRNKKSFVQPSPKRRRQLQRRETESKVQKAKGKKAKPVRKETNSMEMTKHPCVVTAVSPAEGCITHRVAYLDLDSIEKGHVSYYVSPGRFLCGASCRKCPSVTTLKEASPFFCKACKNDYEDSPVTVSVLVWCVACHVNYAPTHSKHKRKPKTFG
jgi:hypothetical protein